MAKKKESKNKQKTPKKKKLTGIEALQGPRA